MTAFDKAYFTGYSHDGRGDYSQVYKQYTVDPLELRAWLQVTDRWPESFLDLGAATGHLLNDMQAALNFEHIEGIEISKWAVENSVNPNIRRGDILKAPQILKGRRFDIVFSNVLMYLNEGKLDQHLADLPSMLTDDGVFVLCTLDSPTGIALPYAGNGLYSGWTAAPTIARTKKWWFSRMICAGFKPVGQLEMASLWTLTKNPAWQALANPLMAAAQVGVKYPQGQRWRGKDNPLELSTRGMTCTFYHASDRWLECDRKVAIDDEWRIIGLAAMVQYFHSGMQSLRDVQLIDQNWYDYVPFTRHLVNDDWLVPVSDEEYQ